MIVLCTVKSWYSLVHFNLQTRPRKTSGKSLVGWRIIVMYVGMGLCITG